MSGGERGRRRRGALGLKRVGASVWRAGLGGRAGSGGRGGQARGGLLAVVVAVRVRGGGEGGVQLRGAATHTHVSTHTLTYPRALSVVIADMDLDIKVATTIHHEIIRQLTNLLLLIISMTQSIQNSLNRFAE